MAEIIINRQFNRIAPDVIAAVNSYPSGYFVDIQDRRGALDHRIRPLFSSPPVYGTAVTIKTVPDDNLAPYMALEILQPGDILVVSNGGWEGSAVIGDLIAGMYRNIGLGAIVTDGLVRDIQGLEKLGLPVFAAGLTPNSPQKHGPGVIGGDVVIGNVRVKSGDLIVGDRDGVVCLPARYLVTVEAALKAVRAKEAGIEKQIADGMQSPQWVKEIASDVVTYAD
ncbi:MAG: RraA family protein [Hyphomicrobiales bacterium]